MKAKRNPPAADPPVDPLAKRLTEQRTAVAGYETFWRSAPAPNEPAAGPAKILYVHGNPTNADDWSPFLLKTGGVALDLPGFGRSEKPASFDTTIGGYNAFLHSFIAQLGWDRFSLVVHDWGALALTTAQDLHDQLERVAIINAVPLLPNYRWHRAARIWRVPLLGEFVMGMTTKSLLRYNTTAARPSGKPLPPAMINSIWQSFDHGTQRTILRLYRSAPSDVLEQAGERLQKITAPTLVVWGEHDPYIASEFGQAYAERLPNARLKLLPDAGHWPWVDRPAVIDDVARFLLARQTA